MITKLLNILMTSMCITLFSLSAKASTVGYLATVESSDDETVFESVMTSPQFPGGTSAMLKFIKESLQYPEDAAEEHIEGTVMVKFIVEKDGSVSNPTIVKGRVESLNKEAIRIVSSMPKWTPGQNGDTVVRSYYTVRVSFKLPE